MTCYSDHNEDIRLYGYCYYCGSKERLGVDHDEEYYIWWLSRMFN